jgi:hypothetical protein
MQVYVQTIHGSRRSVMHRFAVLVSLFVVAFVGVLALGQGRPADAQDQDMASHPVVGAWRFTNDLGGGVVFPSLAIFHADGTYIEDFPDESSYFVGVWKPTGERTAAGTGYQVYVIDDKLVNGEGRFTMEVDETGNTMTSTGTFLGLFEDGSVEFAVDGADGPPTIATRLEVLPLGPLDIPTGTPTS